MGYRDRRHPCDLGNVETRRQRRAWARRDYAMAAWYHARHMQRRAARALTYLESTRIA